jgi:hypothetical protein
MPVCLCGCNQNLTRRAIKNHLHGRPVPRLITAVVKACQTLRSTVSPSRLNPSKKLRSSRRYFPSSPPSVTADEEPDLFMSEGTGEAGDIGARDEEDIVEGANVNRGINASLSSVLRNIWSGFHHDDDAEEEYNEDEDVEGEEEKDIEGELVEDAYDDGDDDDNALSALDMLGEDFERKSVANGEFPCAIPIRSSAYEVQYSWKVKRTRHIDSASVRFQGRRAHY